MYFPDLRNKIKDVHQIYTVIFTCSLLLFLTSFLIQYPLVFSYDDYYGILFKMEWIYWLGYLLLLILIYFNYANFDSINKKFVYLTLFLFTIYLIGTPFFFEYLPRFEDTWSHSFLAQEMFEKEQVITGISDYEQYPGSFLFFGLLFQIIPSYYVMKFFTPFFYFLGLLIVYTLFKYLFNERISFLASVLYVFFNWTIEDNHICPQFLTLYLYFFFMLALTKILSNPVKNMNIYILITSLLSILIIISHPGTPLFLFLILGSIFLLCERFRGILLPVITFLAIIFIFYHLYQTTIFGSYLEMIDKFIQVLLKGTLFSEASMRFSGGLLSRKIFIFSRLGITALSVLLGLLGIYTAHMKWYKLGAKFFFAWAFSMLAFTIFVGLSVKGEYYEKFVLISSLPLAGIGAYCFKDIENSAIILIILLLISPFYFIAKYGNEAIESESLEKLKVDCFSFELKSDCEERQKIVDSQLHWDIKFFGDVDFTVTREEIMANSIFYGRDVQTSQKLIDERFYGLDRIYSTNSAWFYGYMPVTFID